MKFKDLVKIMVDADLRLAQREVACDDALTQQNLHNDVVA